MTNAELINQVHNVDLFDLCAQLDAQSVDCIACDLPYGTTACSWDTVIPFAPMWAAFKRVIKPRGAIVLTASQPFTSALVMSNPTMFRYEWIWEKTRPTGFFHAQDKPLTSHENIVVFLDGYGTYTPQGLKAIKPLQNGRKNKKGSIHDGGTPKSLSIQTIGNFPRSVLHFDAVTGGLHPTQKPVALFEYLIRTYTQEGELVLDPCCGSGTTALAARNSKRQFIVGDSDAHYCDVARDRLRLPFEVRQVKASDDVSDLPLFQTAQEAE